jgi:membrane associated rhomboid family serine protease
MKTLSIKKLGLAVGVTGAIFYLGCIILMVTAGKDGTVFFFNSLLHGLDVEPIIRMSVPPLQAFFGLVQTFILGWLVGALAAAIYNISFSKGEDTPRNCF